MFSPRSPGDRLPQACVWVPLSHSVHHVTRQYHASSSELRVVLVRNVLWYDFVSEKKKKNCLCGMIKNDFLKPELWSGM